MSTREERKSAQFALRNDFAVLSFALHWATEVRFERAINKVRFGTEDPTGGRLLQDYPIRDLIESWERLVMQRRITVGRYLNTGNIAIRVWTDGKQHGSRAEKVDYLTPAEAAELQKLLATHPKSS